MHDIYIEDTGKGFPLVLVHGFLGSSKTWQPQINFFKKNFRVIAPDLPGYGKSKNIKSHNSIKSIANLLVNCLKEKKIDKYNLLGHSMGGMIVQEMAKINGEKISKLVCYYCRKNCKLMYENVGLDIQKDFSTLEYLGNTGAASLPSTLALGAEKGLLESGDRIALLGIGSGLNSLMLGVEW